eukprot:890833_1
MPGLLTQITVGSSNHIYGVNMVNNVYQWKNNKWNKIKGKLKMIKCNSHGHVYGINSKNKIYRYNMGNWTQIPGRLQFLDVDEEGHPWGINNGQIFQLKNNWRNKTKKFNVGRVAYFSIHDR